MGKSIRIQKVNIVHHIGLKLSFGINGLKTDTIMELRLKACYLGNYLIYTTMYLNGLDSPSLILFVWNYLYLFAVYGIFLNLNNFRDLNV